MDYEKVGKLIRKLREENKWSQETLANKLCCDRTKLNKIENGKRYIKIDDLILLSEIFKISLEELISGEKRNSNNEQQIKITFKEYLKSQNTKIEKMRLGMILSIIIVAIIFSLFTMKSIK